ncbi:hypothetical protein [Mycobacterium branderi]|uniref:Chitin-binding type-2 domain-containing protein n=2 Tax=Mycobacterium branderi TaxID=43348 RepID=A0AA91LTX9_9MYCO|nr:hypothetical protein [Mycobacterium branderi]MCV7232192.1 hypothetical protein [Mycobacterium branderi]ORA33801.1 hypothetical protein BST20_21450 [Mycobacterium branderi]
MKNLVGRLVATTMLAVGAMAVIAVPAVSSADPLNCPEGQWWDPTANVCRPLGEGPQPLNCPEGQYWKPGDNVCRPLGQL